MPVFRIGARFVSALVIVGVILSFRWPPPKTPRPLCVEAQGGREEVNAKPASPRRRRTARRSDLHHEGRRLFDPRSRRPTTRVLPRHERHQDDRSVRRLCVGRIRTQLGIAGDLARDRSARRASSRPPAEALRKMNCYAKPRRSSSRSTRVSLEDRDEVRPPSKGRACRLGTASDAATVESTSTTALASWSKRCRCRSRSCVPRAGIVRRHHRAAQRHAREREPGPEPRARSHVLSHLLARHPRRGPRAATSATTRTSTISTRGRTSTPSRAPGASRRIPRWMPSRPGPRRPPTTTTRPIPAPRHPRSAGTTRRSSGVTARS